VRRFSEPAKAAQGQGNRGEQIAFPTADIDISQFPAKNPYSPTPL
jgi:hypothetical protein